MQQFLFALDVYSAGIIFYELLTGVLLRNLSGEEGIEAAEKFEEIPEDLRPLLMALTAKDPAARIEDLDVCIDELINFLTGTYLQV